MQKNNKSGYNGVCFLTEKQKWRAKITVDKKIIFLGLFSNIEDAVKARLDAEIKFGFKHKVKKEKVKKLSEEKIKFDETQESLKCFLTYDYVTGDFYWNVDVSFKTKKGMKAGKVDTKGYEAIYINKKVYRSHRLAWLYVYGKLPDLDLDHINGIKTDNRISNLREVSDSENLQNRLKPNINNKLGILGVSKVWNKNSYQAQITLNGKTIRIGKYKTISEAIIARKNAEKNYYIEKLC